MATNYFSSLSYVPYIADKNSPYIKLAANIFKRVQTTLEAKFNRTLYYPYDILEHDTPESIAYNYYGSANYHWVILLVNEMTDPFWDWPMGTNQFEQYIINKYGSIDSAHTTPHHHETIEQKASVDGYGYETGDVLLEEGIYCNSQYSFSIAGEAPLPAGSSLLVKEVSQYTYELELNESKRSIKVLDSRYLSEFVQQFRQLVADEV